LRGVDIGDGLREPRAVFAIVDPEQHVTCPDRLVVLNLHHGDIAQNLWSERGHVAAHVSIVGRRLAR